MKQLVIRDSYENLIAKVSKVLSCSAEDTLANAKTLSFTTLLEDGLENLREEMRYTVEFENDLYDIVTFKKSMSGNLCFIEISCEHVSYRLNDKKLDMYSKTGNCFGMKASLSGNTWAGSSWDGSSIHTIPTQEQNPDGSYVAITADFRKYACVEDSVADHSAYLLGAKKGRSKRYKGLAGCRDYKKAVQIIKDGGYATDLGYVNKLCNLIERYNLTQYDTGAVTNTTGTAPDTPAGTPLPYLVKVSIPNLNIRKGPGMNYARTGFFTGIGVFTIVDVQSGQGSDTGWGKLKSGAGWISLDYTKKL